MTIKHQIYILGQVYGYIVAANPEWNFGGAMYPLIYPLNACTQALFGAIKNRKIKVDDPYIMARMAAIDAEFEQPVHNVELQGAFTIGQHQIHRDIQRVISATGLTQQDIADKLGVKLLTVGRWFRGETKCPADKQFEIECMAWED